MRHPRTSLICARLGIGAVALLAGSILFTPGIASAADPSLPSSPTITGISDNGAAVTVTWSADPSSTVTSYLVSLIDSNGDVLGTVTLPAGTTSEVFGEVPVGTGYTAQVVAENAAGDSAPATSDAIDVPLVSNPDNSTMPDPPTPTGFSITTTDGGVTVTWTGIDPTLAWLESDVVVNATPGGQQCVSSDPLQTSCVITGLVDGTTYAFDAFAEGYAGDSPDVAAGSGTPTVTTGATAPDAPSGINVSAWDGSAWVSVDAPISDGGSPIEFVTVTAIASDGSTAGTCQAVVDATGAGACDIVGLTNGDTYTFAATATNGAGAGPAITSAPTTVSSSSGGPTPIGTLPVAGVLDTTKGWVVVWFEPSDISAVSYYQVSANGGLSCSTNSQTSGASASCLLSTGATEPAGITIQEMQLGPVMYAEGATTPGPLDRVAKAPTHHWRGTARVSGIAHSTSRSPAGTASAQTAELGVVGGVAHGDDVTWWAIAAGASCLAAAVTGIRRYLLRGRRAGASDRATR